MRQPSEGWWIARRVPELLSASLERRTGGLEGEDGRAAGVVETFAALSVVTTLLSTARYWNRVDLGAGIVTSTVVSILTFVLIFVLAHRGRQLLAAALYLGVCIVGMVFMATVLGWESGHHLYLITAAQLVFLMFTDRQVGWRWLFVTWSAGAFVWCQLGAPGIGGAAVQAGIDLTVSFTVNAMGTATLMFLLSVIAHFRAGRAQAQVAALAARAEYLANTDPLTGLANRRPVVARLEELAGEGGYCLAVADIDRFKVLNDTHGHTCGDRVLAALGERLRGRLRTTDLVGRWGGEEFIFLLPSTALADAQTMMERMRTLVGENPVTCGDHAHDVTVSIGVADGMADGMSHRVLNRADEALYAAKTAGRDCVRARPFADVVDGIAPSAPRPRR